MEGAVAVGAESEVLERADRGSAWEKARGAGASARRCCRGRTWRTARARSSRRAGGTADSWDEAESQEGTAAPRAGPSTPSCSQALASYTLRPSKMRAAAKSKGATKTEASRAGGPA
eukprot:10617934-Alexandrium_andersonii.AAC.1